MLVTTDALALQVQETIAELDRAGARYLAASAALAAATTTEATRRATHDYAETSPRAKLHRAGVEGKNEAERRAYLDEALADDAELDELRTLLDEATERRVIAEADYRVADQHQKAQRAILAALTALVEREGR